MLDTAARKFLALSFAALFMLAAPSLHAQSKPRPGVIEDIQPIENKGDDEGRKTKFGRAIGKVTGSAAGVLANAGVAKSGAGDNVVASSVVRAAPTYAAQAGEELGAKVAGPGESVRYMVKVRLDSGRVMSLPQLSGQISGMKVGDRILVEGRGDEATIHRAQ